jgi:hypothetical protein
MRTLTENQLECFRTMYPSANFTVEQLLAFDEALPHLSAEDFNGKQGLHDINMVGLRVETAKLFVFLEKGNPIDSPWVAAEIAPFVLIHAEGATPPEAA